MFPLSQGISNNFIRLRLIYISMDGIIHPGVQIYSGWSYGARLLFEGSLGLKYDTIKWRFCKWTLITIGRFVPSHSKGSLSCLHATSWHRFQSGIGSNEFHPPSDVVNCVWRLKHTFYFVICGWKTHVGLLNVEHLVVKDNQQHILLQMCIVIFLYSIYQ